MRLCNRKSHFQVLSTSFLFQLGRVWRKKKHSLFIFKVLLHLYVSISSLYTHHFPFLGSCNQSPRIRSACCPQLLSLTRLASAACKSSTPVCLRDSTAAWLRLGKLRLILQKESHKYEGSAHVPIVAWNAKKGQHLLALGELQTDMHPLQLACTELCELWAGTLGDYLLPKRDLLFCDPVVVDDRDSQTKSLLFRNSQKLCHRKLVSFNWNLSQKAMQMF